MKKLVVALGVIGFLHGLTSCTNQDKSGVETAQTDSVCVSTEDNSQNSLNWEGVYSGVTPCADCAGIKVKMTLNQDLTYTLSYQYLGKDDVVYDHKGTFHWNKEGNGITLDNAAETEIPPHYKVGENILWQLDLDGNKITGEHANDYELKKINS